jgi:GGDEF domain-containing protein
MASRLSALGYKRTRQLILIAGLVVLIVVAAVMYARGVQKEEVVGTLLFIPIFLGFVFMGLRGGLIGAVLATIIYAAVRYPAIDIAGFSFFAGRIAARGVAYLAFGAIGGIAHGQLQSSLNKLDMFDQIDDATGLFNARFFVDNAGLEMQRAQRYQTLFAVMSVEIPTSVFAEAPRRVRDRVVKELGQLIKDSVRNVDRGVHGVDTSSHRFAAILPETAKEGGQIFAGRLVAKMIEVLNHRGIPATADQVKYDVFMFPGDEEPIQHLRSEFGEIDAREHPETAHTPERAPA